MPERPLLGRRQLLALASGQRQQGIAIARDRRLDTLLLLAVAVGGLEFKGFVNNGQMAVVMDEARAGIDFGEYPRPEGNRRLQRLRAREQRLPGMRLCGCQQRETDQEADARTCRIEDVDHHDCRSMPCPPCEGFYGACTGEICNYRSGRGCHRTGLWTASFREYLEASRPRARVQCARNFRR